MKLRHVGFFRELRHGMPDGPSLLECVRPVAAEDEDQIVRYLQNAVIMIATAGPAEDVLYPGRWVGPPSIMTDGVWAWPGDLPHCVGTYHAELPAEFVGHMGERDWTPPAENEIDLRKLEY